MSFYSSLLWYRPTPPPRLRGADLADFVTMFASLGLTKRGGMISYGIKFGQSIDQDTEPIVADDPPVNGISVVNFATYDAERSNFRTLTALARELKTLDGTIYRANLSLGLVSDPIFDVICRQPSAENDIPLKINEWGLEIGPIASYSLGSEQMFLVGWMAVSLHGYGYLWPWSFRDLIDRAETVEPITGLTEGCRRLWPVTPDKPGRAVVKARKQMGKLWPYPQANVPWDWSWGLAESG